MEEDYSFILQSFLTEKSSVISLLQVLQRKLGYVPPEAIKAVSHHSGISESEVYGVASFYTQFRFNPPGRHECKVCVGTACHVRGSQEVLEACERNLGVESGGTTGDGNFSLDKVACFGCCALAPVMAVDGEVHGRLAPDMIKQILSKYN